MKLYFTSHTSIISLALGFGRCLWASTNLFLIFYYFWKSSSPIYREFVLTSVPSNLWLVAAIVAILTICLGVIFTNISAWNASRNSWAVFQLFVTILFFVGAAQASIYTCFGGCILPKCPYQPEWFFAEILKSCQKGSDRYGQVQ